MNLRQLRTFVLIAEHGSIRAAARALHLTQPAATRNLRELEQSLDAELVRRSPKGVELTAYGQALYKRAVLILQETRRAQEEIGQMKDGAGGSLHLAVSSSALTVLPGALRDFRQRMPRVSVSFNEVAPPHSHELLESGHYDLLVQTEYGGQIDDGFTRATLYDLPLAVGARVGHPLRRARSRAARRALAGTGQHRVAVQPAAPGLCRPWPAAARDVIPCQSIAVGLALIAESDALGIFVRDLFEHQLLPRPCAWCRWTTRCPPRACAS